MPAIPDGFHPLPSDPGGFLTLLGPLLASDAGVLGLQTDDRHLNRAGKLMGGLLATLADAAFGIAIRDGADGEAQAATVSLTVDFLRPGPAGAWLEAHTEVEQLGGKLAFADCSVRADGEEVARARAVFAVRQEG